MNDRTPAETSDRHARYPASIGTIAAEGVTRGSPAYWRISYALFAAGFATFSLLYCVQPLLPLFAAEFHVGAAQSSLALSLSTGFLAISIICTGMLSEKLGRRGLMFISMALAAAFNILAACMPSWSGLLAARALEGLVLGGVPAVAMAYLAEEIHPNALGLAMGVYVGGTAFGGMIGRVGMSILSESLSWRHAMLIIGAIDLLAALIFVLLLPASRHFKPGKSQRLSHHFALWGKHLANRSMCLLFAVGCLVMGVFVTIYNYAGFRLMAPPFDLSATKTGLIFCSYLFGIVASSSAGALADRFGRRPILVIGVLASIVGIGITLFDSVAAIVVGIVLLTIGFFMTHSVASGWVGRLAGNAKGHASSLYLLAYYVGSSILGSWGGWFWQEGGWPWVAAFSFAALALCLGAALNVSREAVDSSTGVSHHD
jgi:MFS transporter, YNFM family, putative membrane transport protein